MNMLSLYYHELIGKVKQHEGKKYLMIHDYVLDKVLDKIKEIIGIEKIDNTEILIDTDDKLPDNINLKETSITFISFRRSIIRSVRVGNSFL